MKKIISFLVFISAFVAFTNAQTTYNVFTYKKPVGYKEEKKQGFVTYSKTDAKKGTYCIIALYDQTKASATLDESFTSNWQELVAQPYSVTNKPEVTNADEQEGWKTKLGMAQFDFNGGKSAAMLLTLQNGQADANILLITNGKDMLGDLDKLLTSLKMEKPKTTIATNTNPTPTPAPKKNVTTTATTIYNKNLPKIFAGHTQMGTGAFSDYTFSDIPGCTVQQFTDGIQYSYKTTYNNNLLTILPLRNYNNENLEQKVIALYKELFAEYSVYDPSQFVLGFSNWEKGKTVQGFDYIRANAPLINSNDNNITIDGTIACIKAGNKLAIIWGVQPFQSLDYGYSAFATNMFNQLMFTFKINNIAGPGVNIKKELVGNWGSVSSTVGLSYSYHPDQKFYFGAASSFRVSHDAYYDKVTTYSYGNDGTYWIDGNYLTTFYNKKKEVDLVRFYERRTVSKAADLNAPWEKHMYSMTLEGGYEQKDYWQFNLQDMGIQYSNR